MTGGTEVESGARRAVAPIGEDTRGIRRIGGATAVPKRYQIATPTGAAHSSDTQIGQLAFPLLFPMPSMVPSHSAHFMVINHSVRHRGNEQCWVNQPYGRWICTVAALPLLSIRTV
jgi:hypothetical protein